MPIYEFYKESGEVVELFLSFAEFERRVKNGKIKLDGGEVASYSWDQHKLTSTVPANYPMVCTAAGVHPAQIKDQVDHLQKMGCGFVEHTSDGDPIFHDRKQRKRVCEALGLYDRSGGFGDPQAKHVTRIKSYR